MSSFSLRKILCFFFSTSTLVWAQKDHNQKQLNIKNDCQRCKLVTDSFANWYEKTSRGKHEGGDAAWEETKLKSYARSEMRLVEIQESLCSELKKNQDDCYNVLEKADLHLEKWWFQEEHKPLDLYNWLCIDNLKYCCPANHFGEVCTECSRDKNNKICGGNGKCNGAGTRKGDGTCICKKGHKGLNCDECEDDYFNTGDSCKRCHHACVGCYGDGANSCKDCASGWAMVSGMCTDLNECLDKALCKRNEYCLNKDGYYLCNPCDKSCRSCGGPGAYNCTSCKPAEILFSSRCINIDFTALIKQLYARLAFYCTIALFLFIISLLIFRKAKIFVPFIVLVMSIVVYYFENYVM